MFKYAAAMILMLVAASGTQAYAAGCEPNSNEVTLFQHTEYRGACSVLAIGEYPNPAAMRFANDSVSSIKVGANVEILAMNNVKSPKGRKFVDYFIKGPASTTFREGLRIERFRQSQRKLSGTRIGNDSISWVIVQRRETGQITARGDCYPGDNSQSIALYQHPDFKGNCRILTVGTYRNSKEMNFKNDSASSVEFGRDSRVYVELFTDSNFKGRKLTLTESTLDLRPSAIGDNKLTSVKVTRR
jgi:hypothetical protein